MNKKNKTYVLLVLVIVIWGVIGYNIFSHSNSAVESAEITSEKAYTVNTIKGQKEKLIITNYRDPFLGKIFTNKKSVPKKKSTKEVHFPKITYHGTVNSNRVKSYIIAVQNSQEIVVIGQTFQQVKLISANTKEIVVEFEKTRKTIKLQQ